VRPGQRLDTGSGADRGDDDDELQELAADRMELEDAPLPRGRGRVDTFSLGFDKVHHSPSTAYTPSKTAGSLARRAPSPKGAKAGPAAPAVAHPRAFGLAAAASVLAMAAFIVLVVVAKAKADPVPAKIIIGRDEQDTACDVLQRSLALSEICYGNGRCRDGGSKLRYTCACDEGYMPPHCERKARICEINPCKNGAACVVRSDVKAGYFCLCPLRFAGPRCEFRRVGCNPNPCLISGSCADVPGDPSSFKCTCEPGNSGTVCDAKVSCPKGSDVGSWGTCPCKRGYVGGGFNWAAQSSLWAGSCVLDDPCAAGEDSCPVMALCARSSAGKFGCSCKNGYWGAKCAPWTVCGTGSLANSAVQPSATVDRSCVPAVCPQNSVRSVATKMVVQSGLKVASKVYSCKCVAGTSGTIVWSTLYSPSRFTGSCT